MKERLEAAAILQEVGVNCPIVVDGFSNYGMVKYGAFPEALIVIDDSNKIRYAARGPYAYNPDNLRRWVETEVRKSK